MRIALLVNPVSGRRHGERIAGHAALRLNEAGHDVQVVQGHDASTSRESLKHAIDRGLDAVVVVGGDGALHGVLDLLADSKLVFGLLPAGTGNDTARTLGIPVKDDDAALDVILRGNTRRMDLADVDGTFVATVVASGFDSKVNERANAMTWPRGNMRYNIAIVTELSKFEPLDFTITLEPDTPDERTLTRKAMLVAVGNGPSFGGGLRICEGARVDDGLLDVAVINPVSKTKLIRVFPKLYKGTHVTLPEFELHRVRSVRLHSADIVAYGDGERLGELPRTIRVRPGALQVFVP